ncbi:MAG: phytanoyl-CoA dioxygenase family protein [Actinocatenispora sp.]
MPQSLLDTPYPLAPDAAGQFEKDGFIRLPGVLDAATIEAYEPAITAAVIELNTMHLPLAERSTYDRAFLQVTNLWEQSEQARGLVFAHRLARLAAELLDVPAVRLYHDQALYKEAGGGITPWHADQYYWPLATDRVCTAWIPLQDTTDDMGPLAFAAGSHLVEFGRELAISDESEAALAAAVEERGFPVVDDAYALGEVSFHLGWTFHHARPNRTATPRRVMTVIYMDADNRVAEPVNDNQRADLASWMPSLRPGQVPDTPRNPVLYRAGQVPVVGTAG